MKGLNMLRTLIFLVLAASSLYALENGKLGYPPGDAIPDLWRLEGDAQEIYKHWYAQGGNSNTEALAAFQLIATTNLLVSYLQNLADLYIVKSADDSTYWVRREKQLFESLEARLPLLDQVMNNSKHPNTIMTTREVKKIMSDLVWTFKTRPTK